MPTQLSYRFTPRIKRTCAALALAIMISLLAACDTLGGSDTITIGSKDFTEQRVLAEMAAALLEDAGMPVETRLSLGGTAIVHQSLLSGEVDTYYEYTGTGLTVILNQKTEGRSPEEIYQAVKDQYKQQFDVAWLEPLGFNNTYALAMREEQAQELGLTTISGLQGQAQKLTLGADEEFLSRPDGLPGLKEAYGINFGGTRSMASGLMYQAVDSGEVDIISAYATDARINELGLRLLEDDKKFFPPYFAAPVVRQEALDQYPEITDVLNQLGGEIDEATMRQLNSEVDSKQRPAREVAREFLQTRGLLGGGE